MRCRYPIAEVAYDIPGFPVQVSLEALSPAIPQDSEASGIPVAMFQFTLTNKGPWPVEVSHTPCPTLLCYHSTTNGDQPGLNGIPPPPSLSGAGSVRSTIR